jgi:hypothetical protein
VIVKAFGSTVDEVDEQNNEDRDKKVAYFKVINRMLSSKAYPNTKPYAFRKNDGREREESEVVSMKLSSVYIVVLKQ